MHSASTSSDSIHTSYLNHETLEDSPPQTARGIPTTTGAILANTLPLGFLVDTRTIPHFYHPHLSQDSLQAPRGGRNEPLAVLIGRVATTPLSSNENIPHAIHTPTEGEEEQTRISQIAANHLSIRNQPHAHRQASLPAAIPPSNYVPTETIFRLITGMQEAIESRSIEQYIRNFAPNVEDSQEIKSLKTVGLAEACRIRKYQEQCLEAIQNIRDRLQVLLGEQNSGRCCFAPPPPRPMNDTFYNFAQKYTNGPIPSINEHTLISDFLTSVGCSYKEDHCIETNILSIKRHTALIFAVHFDLIQTAKNCCDCWQKGPRRR